MREILADDDEQSLEGGVEDDREDPLKFAPPPAVVRNEETQDYSNIPHRDDNLLAEIVVHQSQEEPYNLSTCERTNRMTQRH